MTTQRCIPLTRLSDSVTIYVQINSIRMAEPDVAPNATGSVVIFDNSRDYEKLRVRVTDTPSAISALINT